MDQISANQALTLFGKWDRENKAIALLLSTPSAAASFQNGRIVPFLDGCLALSFADENTLRIFLSEAKFWRLEASDIPEESREMVPKFEQCVRISSENPVMQCFVFASRSAIS